MRRSEIRPGIRRLFRLAVRRPDDAARGADDEIRLHLALRAEQLVREGMTPGEARAEAERRFGALDASREALHASAARRDTRMRAREWVGSVAHELRLALRGLRRAPGFMAVAVTCIALGVGANAAAFSVFDELVLRPLPVAEPARLVNLAAPGPRTGSDACNQSGECSEVFSLPMFRDLARAGSTVFAGFAGHRLFLAGTAYGGQATEGDGALVSGSYFPTLGIRPAVGRLLLPSDDETIGAHSVAVLSHEYWTTHLGADPAIVGRQLVVNGRSLTVVGVAPRGFTGTTLGVRPRVFVPLAMAATVDPTTGSRADMEDRRRYATYVFARLKPGVTIERARAAMNAAYRPILAAEAPLHAGMSAQTMAQFLARELSIEDGRHGQSTLRGTTRTPTAFLFAITGLVVLIACANIANLLLARGAGRATEMAVRQSLGAGRRQLVVQLLTESCLLAALGGAASLLVARGTLALVASFIPPSSLGAGASLSLALRPSVLGFAAAVSLGTGLLFGLFPALHGTRPDLIASIRSGAGQIAGGHRAAARFRASLVTAQIALSMALLASAGLFVKSLRNVGRVELGLDVDRVVMFGLLPELSGYDAPRARTLLARAAEELRATPGVTAVGASGSPLLFGGSNGGSVNVEGFTRTPDTDANARINYVTPDFLRTLGIRLLAGREFTAADRAGAPMVAIVNEAFAKKFGLGRDVVGRRMSQLSESPNAPLDVEIVGFMRNAAYADVKGDAPPTFYLPVAQNSTNTALAFYVKTSLASDDALRAARAAIGRIDRNLPLSLLKTMPQQVRDNVYLDRMIGTLAASFAALATLLAAVGLYGVLAYTTAQRTREIGVRMALGATAARVRGIVMRQVGRMVLAGGTIGVLGALLLGRAAQSLLYGLRGDDPWVVIAAAALLTVVALGAGYGPAWRASRVSPTRALRAD